MSEDMKVILLCIAMLVTVFVGISAVGVTIQWSKAQFNPPRAGYELETGEYLHCTPEGGDELRCEVTHR